MKTVVANALTFHITMMLSGLPVALVAPALWTLVALPFRSAFEPSFTSRPSADSSTAPSPLVAEA